MVALINDIIHLSQLDEGAEMPLEEVSLLAVAQDVREALCDTARTKNVFLDVCGDEGIVDGVYGLLYEIIYNLCDNGIKYNHPGGSVRVSVEEGEGSVLLQVQDTGAGISPEHRDKVFERFYRVDKSHSKQSGGTGLGLSIVKHAVQLHRGKITLESEEDRGTTVSVLLPAPESRALHRFSVQP